jgi:hypothetical protein
MPAVIDAICHIDSKNAEAWKVGDNRQAADIRRPKIETLG